MNKNGFGAGRSTTDHVSTLNNIIERRKLKRKQTFVAFVNFKKAYDPINRAILWSKLQDSGIAGKILDVIKAIYNDVQYYIRLNGLYTNWVNVRISSNKDVYYLRFCLIDTLIALLTELKL